MKTTAELLDIVARQRLMEKHRVNGRWHMRKSKRGGVKEETSGQK